VPNGTSLAQLHPAAYRQRYVLKPRPHSIEAALIGKTMTCSTVARTAAQVLGHFPGALAGAPLGGQWLSRDG